MVVLQARVVVVREQLLNFNFSNYSKTNKNPGL